MNEKIAEKIKGFIGDKQWLAQPNRPDEQDVKIMIELLEETRTEIDKPITEHPDVQRLIGQVVQLQAEKKAIKAQYAKDLVAINKFYYREPICQNQPPEITNGYDACLSCPMRKTCLLIFEKP